MGRLFWKVFFGFWLTMLAIAAVAALAVFSAQKANEASSEFGAGVNDDRPRAASGRRAERLVFRQALVLRHGGKQAVREMLDAAARRPVRPRRPRRANQANPRPRSGWTQRSVRICDEAGNDIFGRDVSAGTYAAAARRFDAQAQPTGIEQVAAPSGQQYLLFIPQIGNVVPRRPQAPFYQRLSPLALAGTGFVFSMLFSGLLAWYLAQPIRALRQGFERVSKGELDTRVSAQIGSRRDELADLGRDFDTTVAQLQQLIQSQRRLLHDVSHELRSPLARIQAATGLIRQNPARSEQLFERVERETERLDALVGEILTLSRLDAPSGHGQMLAIDLDDMVADIVTDARFENQDKNLRIEIGGAAETPVTGYANLLHRAIENLVRNAVKYTAADSTINVDIKNMADGHIRLRVLDRGPGIDEADLATVTEPFMRLQTTAPAAQADGATETTQTIEGFGLGLAIAKRAVQLHGGQLSLANRTGGGLVATITLPVTATEKKPLATAETVSPQTMNRSARAGSLPANGQRTGH